MYCSLTFYFKIIGSEMFSKKDGYVGVTTDIQFSTPKINLKERAEVSRKGFANFGKVPVENVVSISREEYELNTESDEEDEEEPE